MKCGQKGKHGALLKCVYNVYLVTSKLIMYMYYD